jgi:hypothetical protein
MNTHFHNELKVVAGAQEIVVSPAGDVTVISTGQPGPRGFPGAFGGEAAIQTHVDSSTPHPAYDDMPSLSLLFENGLV